MNRLQKKCLFATASFHLLLVLTIVFGSAFFTRHPKPDETPVLTVIPPNLIEAVFSSGVKNAQPPPPSPVIQPPTPPAQPPPVPQPKPVVTPPPTPKKLSPDALTPVEPPAKPKPHQIKVDVSKPVTRTAPKTTENPDADAEKIATQQAKDRAKAFARALTSISKNSSTSTEIDMPGNSSVSYASYGATVVSVYHQAWISPDNMSSDTAVVRFSVTISRNGSVLSSRIVTSSGDASVDNAVQRMLDRVSFIHEFPEGTKDKQRTYNIDFNATRNNSQ